MNVLKESEHGWKEHPVLLVIWAVWMFLSLLLSLPILCLIWIFRWIRTGACTSQRLTRMMDKAIREGEEAIREGGHKL